MKPDTPSPSTDAPRPPSSARRLLARLRWFLVPVGVMVLLFLLLLAFSTEQPLARYIYGPW